MILVYYEGIKDLQQISVLQLKKGVWKDELTFVAIIKLKTLGIEPTHEYIVVANILKEFTNIISPELLTILSSLHRARANNEASSETTILHGPFRVGITQETTRWTAK